MRGGCIAGKPGSYRLTRALLELACLRWRRWGVREFAVAASRASPAPTGCAGSVGAGLPAMVSGGVSECAAPASRARPAPMYGLAPHCQPALLLNTAARLHLCIRPVRGSAWLLANIGSAREMPITFRPQGPVGAQASHSRRSNLGSMFSSKGLRRPSASVAELGKLLGHCRLLWILWLATIDFFAL